MIRHRHMGPGDLRTVLGWAAEEGWNPGLDDADAFLAADPDGFFLTEDGEAPVAAISVVNHGPGFAFLGLYLCRPEYRGQGIGHALWRHAIGHAGDRTIGLDGVPAQQANYARSGFVHAGETVRYVGPIPGRRGAGIRPAGPGDLDDLIALEAAASGTPKPAYMGAWFAGTDNRRTFVLTEGGRTVGLVTIRRCRSGAKVGPLVAPDTEGATALLAHAAAAMGPEVTIDLPHGTDGLARHCLDLGMAPSFRTARMYRGTPPMRGPAVYAVGTLEIG
ncbi:MAG: GNAT family N-acetyltransferase [Pseudomonadota bacterium]